MDNLNGLRDALNETRDITKKRLDYLEWEDYFMATAFLAAKRSKDPVTQVGACIVNEDKIIVGVGYNGMPKGCHDDEFPWNKKTEVDNDNKHLYVCHAELNAIINKNSMNLKNCTMYVVLFPCNECAKAIIQSGIKKVIYMSDKKASKIKTVASKRMFEAAGISYQQFIPRSKKILIDFDEINN
ncbi:deoxycytidylate deaminase-like [Rhynchophorus ferrugineus]